MPNPSTIADDDQPGTLARWACGRNRRPGEAHCPGCGSAVVASIGVAGVANCPCERVPREPPDDYPTEPLPD